MFINKQIYIVYKRNTLISNNKKKPYLFYINRLLYSIKKSDTVKGNFIYNYTKLNKIQSTLANRDNYGITYKMYIV